jgi:hypothetical protein
MADDSDYPIAAPGWKAIDDACAIVHPGALPHQFTSDTAYDLDSRNPLPAVCVWETLTAQWHYVTYGLSELFEKSSPHAEVSGFGFELGLRLPKVASGVDGEQRPPTWPLALLQGIGHYVMSGHGELDTGHVVDLAGPITGSDALPTALEGVVCVPDVQLGKVDTQFGSVLFLLLVGLTRDELEVMGGWDLARKVGLVTELVPDGHTDLARRSWRTDPRKQAVFRRYELRILLE